MEADRVEALLRDSRPQARAQFRDELEEQLFAPARTDRRRVRLPRPLLVAGATVIAIALGALAMSLAGAGPLADSDGGVEATTNCRTVTVTRRVRVPYVVRSADGRTRIAFRYEKRQRQVRRCP